MPITILITSFSEMEEALKRAQRDNEALKQQTLSASPNPEGSCDDPLEISRDCLQIHTFDVLGRGEFGHVYKARRSISYRTENKDGSLAVQGILIKTAPGDRTTRVKVEGSAPEPTLIRKPSEAAAHEIVAVKVLSPTAKHADREAFRAEIQLMKELGDHSHILRMHGAITHSLPYCLVLEFASDGNLLGVLRKNRPQGDESLPSLSLAQLYSFAWQTADGLEFISSLGFLHRDVAARNVLICDGLTAKVSDFGLSRHVQSHDSSYSFTTGRLPIKVPNSRLRFSAGTNGSI